MLHDGNKNYLRYNDPTTGKDVVIVETISPKTGVSMGYEIMTYEKFAKKFASENKNKSALNQALYGRYK